MRLKRFDVRCRLLLACFGLNLAVMCQTGPATAPTRAEAALRLAIDLGIPHNDNAKGLYGLFPAVFPGGYDGQSDLTYYDRPATLETVVVALVRWAGWDTVHYDNALAGSVKPYVSPEGFPFYQPDPTPRSIPYIVVALDHRLIQHADLERLRKPASLDDIDKLAALAKKIHNDEPVLPVLVMNGHMSENISEARRHPGQLLLLPRGFSQYGRLAGLPNKIVDMNSPDLRIYNMGSTMASGRQEYFPLGPLESQLAVGLRVPRNSYVHQAQALYGLVENDSPTVNAVGLWGRAHSMARDARVWGGFILASTAEGKDKDAQLVGLEVDVINSALAGKSPNRSKSGIQVVGIGSATVTNAIEIIGAGPAKWTNGILFEPGALEGSGSVIGLAGQNTLDRGIDFSNTTFRDSAIILNQGSSVSFRNLAGNRSSLYTDNIGKGHLVMQAAADGLRITDNTNSRNLLTLDQSGAMSTPAGKVGIQAPPPQHATDSCIAGSWAVDANYFYICIQDRAWKRSRLEAW